MCGFLREYKSMKHLPEGAGTIFTASPTCPWTSSLLSGNTKALCRHITGWTLKFCGSVLNEVTFSDLCIMALFIASTLYGHLKFMRNKNLTHDKILDLSKLRAFISNARPV